MQLGSMLPVAVLVAVMSAGCGGENPFLDPGGNRAVDLSAEQGRLDAARARWQAAGPLTTYALELRRDCFCASTGRGPVFVRVKNGTLEQMFFSRSGDGVPFEFARFFFAVGGLFHFVQDAIDREAERMTVEYDDELGFPVLIEVDYRLDLADEEISYRVLQFQNR